MEVCLVLAGSSMTILKDLAKEADTIIRGEPMGFTVIGNSGVHKPMFSSIITMPWELCFYHMKFGKEARK